MPTRTQIIICWLAFAAALELLSVALHAVVPSTVTFLDDRLGSILVAILMVAGWGAAAFFGYRPLVKRHLATRLANRRGRSVDLRQ